MLRRAESDRYPGLLMPRDDRFLLFGTGLDAFSWRGIYLLMVYFVGAILAAAILSPLVYWGAGVWAEIFPNRLNSYLVEKEFGRYFDRVRWVSVLLLLPWFVRKCGIDSWSNLGLEFKISNWRTILIWAVLGSVLMGIVALIQILVYDTEYRLSEEVGIILVKGLLAGLVVAFVEEAVFRGIVLRLFYTAMTPLPAVLLSSLFFAFVHFKQLPQDVASPEGAVIMGSGLSAAFWTVFSITHTFDTIWFLNYFLVGLLLALLFLRSRSLWPCVGMHGGWVASIAIYEDLIVSQKGPAQAFLGSPRMIDGLLSAILLALVSLILFRRPLEKI